MLLEPLAVGETARRGYRRVAARLTYRDASNELLWFDIPGQFSNGLNPNADAWLLAVLPVAFQRGVPLEILGAVSPRLLRNADAIMSVWRSWFPDRVPVPIRAAEAEAAPGEACSGTRAGLFFTGGVDSTYSLLRLSSGPAPGGGVDDLIYVCGYDVPLENRAALERKVQQLREVAKAFGKQFIPIYTNLRQTQAGSPDWGTMLHGPALGAAGHVLGRRFSRLLISDSGEQQLSTRPWGTHPRLDELMSTEATRVERSGGDTSRFEKTAFITRAPGAARHLHVCWRSESEQNCGRCEKCLRTMAALEILGAREAAVSFPWDDRTMERLRECRLESDFGVALMKDLRSHALEMGRDDVAGAAAACLASRERHVPSPSGGFLRRLEKRVRTVRKNLLEPRS